MGQTALHKCFTSDGWFASQVTELLQRNRSLVI